MVTVTDSKLLLSFVTKRRGSDYTDIDVTIYNDIIERKEVKIMNELVNMLMTDRTLPLLFTFKDFEKLGYIKHEFDNYIKEAVQNKYIENIYGDIYSLTVKYTDKFLPRELLAQMIMPDSYVSLYYVLYEYGWIPETIFPITSVTTKEKCIIDTETCGTFMYDNVYNKEQKAGIYLEEDSNGYYKIATPLRALCDLLYSEKKSYTSTDELYEDYRIDKESIIQDVKSKDFDELQGTFGIESIEDFLKSIRKELQL